MGAAKTSISSASSEIELHLVAIGPNDVIQRLWQQPCQLFFQGIGIHDGLLRDVTGQGYSRKSSWREPANSHGAEWEK